jgi:hypothetical protein
MSAYDYPSQQAGFSSTDGRESFRAFCVADPTSSIEYKELDFQQGPCACTFAGRALHIE